MCISHCRNQRLLSVRYAIAEDQEFSSNLDLTPALELRLINNIYRNDPKFSDRYAWANSADPDQTAPRGVCLSVCIVWTHYYYYSLAYGRNILAIHIETRES